MQKFIERKPTTRWWEAGVHARAARRVGRLRELPRVVREAVAISWRADGSRSVAVATVAAGLMATFGLLATQRVLLAVRRRLDTRADSRGAVGRGARRRTCSANP